MHDLGQPITTLPIAAGPLALRRPQVSVYAEGLQWQQQAYRWADLAGVTLLAPAHRHPLRCTIHAQDRALFTLDTHLPDQHRLANIILDRLLECLAPTYHQQLAAGGSLSVGDKTLTTKQAITRIGKTYARTDVRTRRADFFLPTQHLNSDPHLLVKVLFTIREWSQATPAHAFNLDHLRGLDYVEGAGDISMHPTMVIIEPDYDDHLQVLCAWLDMALQEDETHVQLLNRGQAVVAFPRHNSATQRVVGHVREGLAAAQRYRDMAQQVAAGNMLDFGAAQLWHDRMVVRGQTLAREAVRYVVQQDVALTLYGAWWEPRLALDADGIDDWHLLAALLDAWGLAALW